MSAAAILAIDSRIRELAVRLSGEETARARKRVLQKLGKLKKERAALQQGQEGAGDQQENRKEEEEEGDDGDSDEGGSGDEGPSSKRCRVDAVESSSATPSSLLPLQASRKKMKAKMKLINRELAQLAMKKQLKLSLKKLRQAANRGYEPFFDVHTFTNLINCYVRCGDNAGASSVLQEMRRLHITPNVVTHTILLKGLCEAADSNAAATLLADGSWQPNLRAVNTFLRGCVRSGDVSLAETAFARYFSTASPPSSAALVADITSYAYMNKLLCQSVQVDRAVKVVDAAEAVLASAGPDHVDESDLISLAGMHADVATALSLLARVGDSAEHVNAAKQLLQRSRSCRLHQSMLKKIASSGGDSEGGEEVERSDSHSMQLFNQHQRNELEIDLELVGGCNSERSRGGAASVAARLSRVFSFPHGDGYGDGSEGDAFERTAAALADSLISRFGLRNLAKLAIKESDPDALARKAVHALVSSLDGGGDNVTLKLGPGDVKMELCSGNGGWLVSQALAEPRSTWVGLELRSDRVYRTFAHSCLQNSNGNLVCIGGDAGVVVKRHIAPNSISAVFINHPEPPERTGGEADSQGGHLLTAAFFADVHAALKKGSGVSIVTDNLPYAKSLQLILTQLISSKPPLFRSRSGGALADSCTLEESAGEGAARLELWRLGGAEALAALGHAATSSSYFDRLWNMGKKKRRWALCVEKV